MKIKNPRKFIYKYYKNNINAGFDIYSNSSEDEVRHIEVKTTTKNDLEFFITSNEVNTLKVYEKNAYIYFVKVYNVETKNGEVIKELQNPIRYFKHKNILKPVLFTGTYID